MISRFTFTRGDRLFEVLVDKIWTPEKLTEAKIMTPKALPIFLEEDDFKQGKDIMALDIVIMRTNFQLINGENLISNIPIETGNLKLALENEIRKFASKARAAYFMKIPISAKDLLVTLSGIEEGFKYLKMPAALINEDQAQELSNFKGTIFPQKRMAILLSILQKWEDLLN